MEIGRQSTEDFLQFILTLTISLGFLCGATRFVQRYTRSSETKSASPKIIQESRLTKSKANSALFRFLSVYLFFIGADWCQGPYFHEVYAVKALSEQSIAFLFLCGYASATVFGPFVGRFSDLYGQKKTCFIFCGLFVISASAVLSDWFPVLIVGRFAGGLASALLHTAPEAWFVSEQNQRAIAGSAQASNFSWQHSMSSFVAIISGHVTTVAVEYGGVGAVFKLSAFLALIGACVMAAFWDEHYGGSCTAKSTTLPASKPVDQSMWATVQVICNDRCIFLIGAVQAFFDAAIYMFVLVWASMLRSAASFQDISSVPFGRIFSCYMLCCMLGSSLAERASQSLSSLWQLCAALLVALGALLFAAAPSFSQRPSTLVLLFCVLEIVVGFYKPVLSSLRAAYLPCKIRGSIMTFYRVPLNFIVVSVFLAFSLGVLDRRGVLYCAALSSAVACAAVAGIGVVGK